MVDLFMYRDPDATKEADKAEVVDEGAEEEQAEPEQVVGGASAVFADGDSDGGDDVEGFGNVPNAEA